MNIPYGQSSAKLPVIQSLARVIQVTQVTLDSGHLGPLGLWRHSVYLGHLCHLGYSGHSEHLGHSGQLGHLGHLSH